MPFAAKILTQHFSGGLIWSDSPYKGEKRLPYHDQVYYISSCAYTVFRIPCHSSGNVFPILIQASLLLQPICIWTSELNWNPNHFLWAAFSFGFTPAIRVSEKSCGDSIHKQSQFNLQSNLHISHTSSSFLFFFFFGLVYIMMMGLSISVTYHGIHLHLLQFPFYMQIVIFATKRSDGKVRFFCATLNGCVCVFFSAFLVSKNEIKRNNGIGSNPSETRIKFGAGEISYSYLWLYVLNTPQLWSNSPPPIRSPSKISPLTYLHRIPSVPILGKYSRNPVQNTFSSTNG